MKSLFSRSPLSRLFGAVALTALIAPVGCSMGSLELSGPATTKFESVKMTGSIHGGQQAVGYSTIQLYAVGNTGYGKGATALITNTGPYYPGGATGCSASNNSITSYTIVNQVMTITANNTMIVGQLVTFSGLTKATFLNGLTLAVTGATATTFTVAVGAPDTPTTLDSGAATPTCYSSVTSDQYGSFTITGDYTCPAGALVYLTGTGGNPGITFNTSNPNLKMAVALGSCSTLFNNSSTTFTTMNEVTTAAAAFALGQFYGTGGFGAPNTTQATIGITNAFATAATLVNSTTGVANTTLSTSGSGGAVTITPEAAKLNTIADVLAACVNSAGVSDGTNCTTLFADSSPTGALATDTLQAAVNMSLNPTSNNANGSANNLTALYGLVQSAGAPFSPTVAAQPSDWTVGIQYTSGAALPQPLDLAADSNGNIWVISTSAGLAGITPSGTASFYSNAFGASSLPLTGPRNIKIDTNNNIFVSSSSSPYNEIKYNPGTGSTPAAASTATVLPFLTPANKSPYGLAIDGNNNVFYGLQSSSATVEVVEFLGGNLATTSQVTYPNASATPGTAGASGANSYIDPEYMAIDTVGNLWITSGSGTNTIGTTLELTNINTSACGTTFPCALTTSTTANTYVASAAGGQGTPFGLAANANGVIWVANSASGNNSVTSITGAGGTNNNTPGTATNYAPAGGFSSPHYIAVDGSGNVWVANKNTGTAPSGGTVSEISSTGTLLSPTPISPALAPNGFPHVGLSSGEGIAVDPSGNVWVANNTSGFGIEEIVGAAAPTVTPTALALKNGTVATRP